MIRLVLDKLYLFSGYIAAVFLLGLVVAIIGQILGRFVGAQIDSTELAGFCLSAATFLGFAYTFRSGSHIRVKLFIGQFEGKARQAIELWCCGIGAIATGYTSFYSIKLVWGSYRFGEISPGLLAVPLWIPQLGMAAGLAILTVCFIDEFVRIALGHRPHYDENEESSV